MAITLEDAKKLPIGSWVHTEPITIVRHFQSHIAVNWKITSIKTWKRNPNRILIGLKHGLYVYYKADENDLQYLSVGRVEIPRTKKKIDSTEDKS